MRRSLPALLLAFPIVLAAAPVDFDQEIRPLLESRCLSCHNPNIAKGDLVLSEKALVLDPEAGLVVPGDASASDLYRATVPEHAGEKPEMPEEGDPLTAAETELLRRWIDEGAAWPEGLVLREASKADASWWAYQKLAKPELKSIDEHLEARLAEEGLAFNPPADRRILIRRATYDLHGLPPTPREVEAFVADPAPEDEAYAALLDRLLASPRYGERWGRHWLDVVRFGESNGFERNVLINELWPFRDYVIGALNEDRPFDQFLREHLAGDLLGGEDAAIGSAFLVAGPYDNVGNQDAVQKAQIRANTLDEIIAATSGAFLGMTVGCARCHDHKFDPISQRDYYKLYATFSGIRHGAVPLGNAEERAARQAALDELHPVRNGLQTELGVLDKAILLRGRERLAQHEAGWTRPPVDRTGTEEIFPPVTARFVRLISEGLDTNPATSAGFRIQEFEAWSTGESPRNVALASAGAKATGAARKIEDFPGAYGPQLAIDGARGKRFFAAAGDLTIEFAEPQTIDRVVFDSARGEENPGHSKFVFVGEYRIEVSDDGKTWRKVASGGDRKPVSDRHRDHRLRLTETTEADRTEMARLRKELAEIDRQIAAVPKPRSVWIGTRSPGDAKGPHQVFVGGNPQRRGEPVVPASLSTLAEVAPTYELPAEAPEAERRKALADWITSPANPLTLRVLANRVWHYHFGTGIVDTPSDFGWMGGRPTHPVLLDYLAQRLLAHSWRIKPLHREIMMSLAYRQSSAFRESAAGIDGGSRLLWRFPPRRLSAEEIRDTILVVSGKLDLEMGGPGFKLYRYLQDNVATYEPLDEHGPDSYRRAVYHQNARASVVDLMTDFDQPDCAFSTPRRAETTTPLQALTLLNHSFTLDMAEALAARVEEQEKSDLAEQLRLLYQLLYQRDPGEEEGLRCQEFARVHGLRALCRALLNSAELLHLD